MLLLHSCTANAYYAAVLEQLYFGVNAIGLWYWCTDMAIAQRVLAAKNLQHARAACLFAAVLKITPVFIMCCESATVSHCFVGNS